MLAALKAIVKYDELFVPGHLNPTVVLQNLIQSGMVSTYFLYAGENEVRIAINELIKVAVSRDVATLNSPEGSYSEPVGDPLKQVEALLASVPLEQWTAYGYVAFDMARFYSPYSKAIAQELLHLFIPEIELRFTSKGVYVRSIHSLAQIRDLLTVEAQLPNHVPAALEVNRGDRQDYLNRIQTLIKAIQDAELHKAIISRSFKFQGNLDLLGTYVVGSKVNTSARSYCFDLGNVRGVGFSPEILMTVDQAQFVITNPLAATRPRGGSASEDQQLSDELFTDAKEVKEHALSIWLAQAEIGSLCVPGTIQVSDFMEVKKYRCVQHLSSRVGGQLKSRNTLWDALKVLFPGITVSGIGKNQALEWIDRLEEEPRGLYAGGIGWVNSDGMTDLAIAIRSVYQYNDWIYLNAGAGIVAESIPHNEYIESVNKMNTMLTNLVLEA
jgi:salicylate synthetase